MRIIAAISAVSLAGLGAAFAYAWEPSLDPVQPVPAARFEATAVRQGANLALVGDCATCHTTPGGRTFAGGLAMPTPFGTIYSTNITPDPETGIGLWSEAAFVRAMRKGVDREGRHLYPAFPYDHFTLTSDEDLRSLYAYFMTREPVRATAPANALPFPINIRLVLAGWKLLFFRERRFEPDPRQDATWNRGRYLVEGLGHCGACHSPRNLMGAEETSRAFEGGEAEGWHAYALGRASQAAVPWSEEELARYLGTGFSPVHGVARGPMAPVAENLARVPPDDVSAIARYMASLGAGPGRGMPPAPPPGPGRDAQSAGSQAAIPDPQGLSPGASLYAALCASCHQGGRPVPLGGIDLAFSTATTGESAKNLVNVIFAGLPAAGEVQRPIMPGFAPVLTDAQAADLIDYIRSAIGRGTPWTDVAASIRSTRAQQRAVARPAAQVAP